MSNPMGDRNLLVGILAWQKKFIGSDVLVAALNTWTLAKEKGLAQILREQKALTENHHALLEEAVHDHLSRHGNDVQKSLAALRRVDPVKQELAVIADPDLQASLTHVASASPAVEPAAAVVNAELVAVAAVPKKMLAPRTPVKSAAKKSAAPARGRPMLVWLAGCALGGGFAVLIASVGIVLVVVLFPEIARLGQGKPVVDPVPHGKEVDQAGDKPAPIKEPVAPDDPLPGPVLPIDPDPPNPLPVKPPPPALTAGFVPLFNGKDLTGWTKPADKKGEWRVVDGLLCGANPAGTSFLLTTRDDYKDFHLRVEARQKGLRSSGVMFRHSLDLIGYDVGLGSDPVMNRLAAIAQLPQAAHLRSMRFFHTTVMPPPPGEWFLMEIIAEGNHLRILVNGKTSVDAVDAMNEFRTGRIGLRDLKQGIEIRAIEIKELRPAANPLAADPDGFVPLFNGKDLTGWKPNATNPDAWRVVNGLLTGDAQPRSILYTARDDYKDFHLRAEARVRPGGHSGVMFRYTLDFQGYETSIGDGNNGRTTVRTVSEAGGNFRTARGLSPVILEPLGEWILVEIIAQGNRLHIKMNGKTTAEIVDAKNTFASGHIGLRGEAKQLVEFRKLDIKELKPAAAPVVAADGFVPLFNGKDLTGWKTRANLPGNWRVVDGILTGSAPNLGYLVSTRDDYKDFHLRVEARIDGQRNNGAQLELRGPADRQRGYEIYLHAPPLAAGELVARRDDLVRFGQGGGLKINPGEWFTLEALAEGKRMRVLLNGKLASEFVDSKNEFTESLKGCIALRHAPKAKLEFRKIEIKELPAAAVAPLPPRDAPPFPAEDGFVSLFNGKDLAGWQPHAKRPGNWRVENGVLSGSAPIGGSLYSTRADYQDFHLRAEVRINDQGFGRIFSRATYDPTKIPFKVLGYEVLINQRPLGDKTGTLTATSLLKTSATQAKESPAPAGAWLLLEVLAKGDLITVKVNGAAVAEFRDVKQQFARTGHIALHQDANATIDFRKIEIRELPAR